MGRGRAWLALGLAGVLASAAACGDGAAAGPGASPGAGQPGRVGGSLILATTTSTQDSGLLEALVPLFEAATGTRVKVIAVGSGAALAMARRGDADAVLSHAPEAEAPLVAAGDLVEGRRVMHNDFVLVGPPADPAGVRGAGSIEEAMGRIAARGTFISRGDTSGTHAKELALWRAAGLDPAAVRREETGQGMGATLNIADQRRGYTLTDRATYLALRGRLALEVLFEGAAPLLNVYHVYVVNPAKHPRVNAAQARAWAAFLVAPETQRVIGEFGRDRFGQPLFTPGAGTSAGEPGR